MPDTLKAQHTAHLTKGFVLYSDMGRVLASITDDTCGWHDPLCGHLDAAQTTAKFGEARYQQHRNDFHRNSRDNFLIELEKYGLSLPDLPVNVNFFSKVVVGEDGALHYTPENSEAGSYVELRAEMNVLVVLDTCQHPLDPNPGYRPRSIKLEVLRATAPASDDLCRTFRPENERGFINTERYFL
jgi:urea carboxylase-associated protein 2